MPGDLIALLVRKGVVRDPEAREILFRSAGVIRHFPAHSSARLGYETLAGRLRERLSWPPGTAPLPLDPLPSGAENDDTAPPPPSGR